MMVLFQQAVCSAIVQWLIWIELCSC